jgi:hypothetical protein
MKRVFFGGLLSLAVTACVHDSQQTSTSAPHRQISSNPDEAIADLSQETPKLVYISYRQTGKADREEITQERWNGQNGGFSEGGRSDYLRKMYFANTRDRSLKGIRHAACFLGSAQNVEASFFKPDNRFGIKIGSIRDVSNGRVETKTSTDGRMLAISFEHENSSQDGASLGAVSFRMLHCNSGKGSISDDAGPVLGPQTYKEYQKPKRATASEDRREVPLAAAGKGFEAKPFDRNYGFRILDKSDDPQVQRRFVLRADYDKAPARPTDEASQLAEAPWRGLKIRDVLPARAPNLIESMKLVLMAQAYFYENMANQSANPDDNFIADANKNRYWCHMPWMNVGPTGREAIHGLTQERDMKQSTQIPVFKNATAGSNWGVAYFNAPGCRTLNQVFGSSSNPLEKPDFTRGQFENGTMITKILFTTANFPELKDAFSWHANVSEPGSTVRRIKTVRHIQMDIAIRDNSIQGVSSDLADWLMAGFYYDPNYDYDKDIKPILKMENPLKKIKGLPKAFFKMRPMGIQTGFDTPATGDTVLFPGAASNGAANRLNGPADNSKSSCLGCHGTAGTTASMVPGFMSEEMFRPFIGKTMLDFNQQLALARSNYETESR